VLGSNSRLLDGTEQIKKWYDVIVSAAIQLRWSAFGGRLTLPGDRQILTPKSRGESDGRTASSYRSVRF
jgi:hypothetical protein